MARFTLEEFLLQLSLCNLDLNGLINLLRMATLVIGIVLDSRREKGVNECGLSQSRFSSNLKQVNRLNTSDIARSKLPLS